LRRSWPAPAPGRSRTMRWSGRGRDTAPICVLRRRTCPAPSANHHRSVQDESKTDQVKDIERARQGCIGLDEFPGEALQAVPADHDIKAVGEPERVALLEPPQQHG